MLRTLLMALTLAGLGAGPAAAGELGGTPLKDAKEAAGWIRRMAEDSLNRLPAMRPADFRQVLAMTYHYAPDPDLAGAGVDAVRAALAERRGFWTGVRIALMEHRERLEMKVEKSLERAFPDEELPDWTLPSLSAHVTEQTETYKLEKLAERVLADIEADQRALEGLFKDPETAGRALLERKREFFLGVKERRATAVIL